MSFQAAINHVRTLSTNRQATFRDYIIQAIAKAYHYAESEGEANYLSTKFVLRMIQPLNPRMALCMGNGDAFIKLNNQLRLLAAGWAFFPDWFKNVVEREQRQLFVNAAKRLQEATSRHYLYIFVRQDMIPEQQAVQAAHATFVAGTELVGQERAGKYMDPNTTHFVLIGVPDLNALLEAKGLANINNIRTCEFFEEDMGGQMTAFTTGIVTQEKRSVFKQYGLMKFRREG